MTLVRFGASTSSCAAVLVGHDERAAAHEHVEVLAGNHVAGLFLHLVFCQVNEQVGHAEDRVALVLAHVDGHDRAVLLGDDAVHRERQRDPLVLLDAAVVVRVEVQQLVALEQRVLLQVEARRVDVRAQDVEAAHQRISADVREDDGLAVRLRVHLVARLQRRARIEHRHEVAVARRLGHVDGGRAALAFGLVLGYEVDIAGSQLLELRDIAFAVFLPDGSCAMSQLPCEE